jgi:hypothetical protein
MVRIWFLPGGPLEEVTPIRAHLLCSSGLAYPLDPIEPVERAVRDRTERAVIDPPARRPRGRPRKHG